MVEFGFFALALGFCLAVYGLIMGTVSVWRPVRGVIFSARNALVGVSFCVIIAALTMWYALFTHDFSVKYVYRNSSVDMPPMYLFTAFWSALEGSHLLWTLLISIMISVALLTVRPRNEGLMPGLCAAFGFVLSFMMLLTVWASAPLSRLFPLGQFGQGMNALLQNPYMAAHPPSLFAGYCSLVVPFGYAMAALIRGSFTPEWLVTLRRWTLAGWAVLTIGIFLGGKWAYVELGWAGYWAWDPVENSSFMPWLASTASLHTLLILDKTNRLPRLACFLSVLSFLLTFLGTFITRSGVISSVHSFAESDIGPAYLIFIVLLLSGSVLMLFTRGNLLQGAARSNTWTLSKESTLLFTNFFLLFLLALVCVGTLLPLIVEATRGVKISIQQPFFNAFAPYIAFGLVSILGLGNLLRWRNGRLADALASLGFTALWSIFITGALWYQKNLDILSTVGFFLIIWTAGSLIMDFFYKLRALRFNGNVFLKYNRPYLGSFIVHMGFLIAIAGFLGGYRGIQAEAKLNLNESTSFYGYTLTNKGLSFEKEYNVQLVRADVSAQSMNGETTLIQPTRSKYTNKEEWLNEIGVHSTFWHDVYLVLGFFDPKTQQISLKMHINPTVKLVWTSLFVMVIGAMIGLTHRIKRRSLDVTENGLELETATASLEDLIQHEIRLPGVPQVGSGARGEGVLTSMGILIFVVSLSVFGLSGVAMAQAAVDVSPPPPVDAFAKSVGGAVSVQINPKVREVGEELRCPTCQGISVLESGTPQSLAMRAEIERQLSEGKTKDQILDYFKDRYGEWILRKPDSRSTFGFWVWAIPVGGLVAGPALLVLGIKRSRQREMSERNEIIDQLRSFLAAQCTSSALSSNQTEVKL